MENSIYPSFTPNLWIKLEKAEWFKAETTSDKANVQVWFDSLNFPDMATTITSKKFYIVILSAKLSFQTFPTNEHRLIQYKRTPSNEHIQVESEG